MDAVFPLRSLLPILFPDPFIPPQEGGEALLPPPRVLSLVSPVTSFPLRYLRTLPSPTPSPRLLLLGDAAQVMHPLAGQGMNVALREVERRVREVEGKVEAGGEAGVEVDGDGRGVWGAGMGLGVDLLWRVFGAGRKDGLGPADSLRGWGLTLFNAASDVKYKAAEQSMGVRVRS